MVSGVDMVVELPRLHACYHKVPRITNADAAPFGLKEAGRFEFWLILVF